MITTLAIGYGQIICVFCVFVFLGWILIRATRKKD